jgi:hypothetical protein
MTKTFGLVLASAALSLILTLGVAEIFLRLAPETIATPLLAHFPSPLKHVVAERLGLPTLNRQVVITTEERSDRGPPLFHAASGSVFRRALDAADVAAGAVEDRTLDSRGFCNPPETEGRPTAEIVSVGDSFTFCSGVRPEETATADLERETGRATYNLGVPNTGLAEYVELLKRYGVPMKPRIVLFNVYEGNDLRDAEFTARFKATGQGPAVGVGRFERAVSISYAASLLWAGWDWAAEARRAGRRRGPDIDFHYTGMSQGRRVAMNVVNADLDEVLSARRLKAGELSPELWAGPLAELKALSVHENFTPIVTYLPSMHSAYSGSVAFRDPAVGDVVQAQSAAQRSWLAAETARLGLAFVDVTPALQTAAETGPLTHLPANVHLTPYGHEIVAREQARAIERVGSGS